MHTQFRVFLVVLLSAASLAAQHRGDHDHAAMVRRGDAVMGFSHDTTAHHFRLRDNGGEIEALARDAADAKTAQAIREHFRHIARMFADGDFTAPMLIHAQHPPGVDRMKASKGTISYVFEEIPAGGRVRITTANAEARDAVHAFLRFQITDHRTGDPLTIQK